MPGVRNVGTLSQPPSTLFTEAGYLMNLIQQPSLANLLKKILEYSESHIRDKCMATVTSYLD